MRYYKNVRVYKKTPLLFFFFIFGGDVAFIPHRPSSWSLPDNKIHFQIISIPFLFFRTKHITFVQLTLLRCTILDVCEKKYILRFQQEKKDKYMFTF